MNNPISVATGQEFGNATEVLSQSDVAIHSDESFASAARDSGKSRDGDYVKQFLRTSWPLWLADQTALLVSLPLAAWAVMVFHGEPTVAWTNWFFGLALVGTFTAGMLGLYPAIGLTADSELRLTSYLGLSLFAGAAVAHLTWTHAEPIGALLMVYAGIPFLILTPTLRQFVRRLLCRTTWWPQPVLVFGSGDSGKKAYQSLMAAPERGLRPVGIIDDLHRHWRDNETNPSWYLGPWSEAADQIERHHVFRGILPLDPGEDESSSQRLNQLAGVLPHLIVIFDAQSPLAQHTTGDVPLVGLTAMRIDQRLMIPAYKWAKRAMDLSLLFFVGLFVVPAIAALAVLVRCTSRGPVFFAQQRIGIGGRRFRMWKFRSMVVNAEEVLHEHLDRDPALRAEWRQFHKLRRDPRVTPIGKLLRITSLDELPQIWNVLVGEMSFVGPRPYPLYEHEEMNRKAPVIMRVRPGVTGLWQISGRSRSSFERRLQIDAAYVRNWSPWFDLHILTKTIRVVALCDGAY